jgi:hypothetical protein
MQTISLQTISELLQTISDIHRINPVPLTTRVLLDRRAIPFVRPQPHFQIGQQVQWQPMPSTDFGTITGLEYTIAPHSQQWSWRYTIKLHPQSASTRWVDHDLAWESDIEPFPTEA